MKHWISVLILLGTLAGGVSAAGQGPEITVMDNKYSVSADTISLGRLLRLFDQATGMRSKVPTELTDRNWYHTTHPRLGHEPARRRDVLTQRLHL